jgi:predicted NUDIX family NTP pyrophosphohydrolase
VRRREWCCRPVTASISGRSGSRAEAPDISADDVASNLFEIEWPPRSGTLQSFPEVDRAAWFDAATARGKLVKGQQDLVDRLIAALAHAEPSSDGAAT